MKQLFTYSIIGIVTIFALIGLAFSTVFVGMQFHLFNVRGSIAERNQFFASTTAPITDQTPPCVDKTKKTCSWTDTPEWLVIQGGLTKDKDIIMKVSSETGVSPRMIASAVVPEQIRFFTSEREVFKRYFEPLKILGSMSQFSLGVSGIKQETATMIEQNAIATSSPFYPGIEIASLIAYTASTTDQGGALYNRLTDAHNHYYSYLYTAIYIKEIEAQWRKAGFPIDKNPEAIVTLFNIGFQKSNPNANPQVGGAGITTGGTTYPYGQLGGLFYNSAELALEFSK